MTLLSIAEMKIWSRILTIIIQKIYSTYQTAKNRHKSLPFKIIVRPIDLMQFQIPICVIDVFNNHK